MLIILIQGKRHKPDKHHVTYSKCTTVYYTRATQGASVRLCRCVGGEGGMTGYGQHLGIYAMTGHLSTRPPP